MGILGNNIVMSTVAGRVGSVYFRTVRGKQIVCAMPERKAKATPKQLACQQRFGEASKRTKELLKDPALKEKYSARTNNKKFSAHMVAQSDMMNAPVVENIDTSSYKGAVGDRIIVKATDNFGVAKVIVTVKSSAGVVIESGEAELVMVDWHYKARVSNPDYKSSTISVEAFDLPGNVGKKAVCRERLHYEYE